MKKRHTAEQIVAKLREAEVELALALDEGIFHVEGEVYAAGRSRFTADEETGDVVSSVVQRLADFYEVDL